jgi:MFS family permease
MRQTSFEASAPMAIDDDAAPAPAASYESASGVAWAAIIAGAFAASAFSLALVALGAGIGLVSVSPWSTNNPSIATFGVLAAAWFIAVQLFASGIGGYLAGRLRTRWAHVHSDEVYFRDTAHGLLVWAVGAVISAGLIALAASSALSGAAHLAGAATQAAGATAATQGSAPASSLLGDPTAYFADMLFRSDHPAQGSETGAQMEVRRILARALTVGDLPAVDRTYVAQLVAG